VTEEGKDGVQSSGMAMGVWGGTRATIKKRENIGSVFRKQ